MFIKGVVFILSHDKLSYEQELNIGIMVEKEHAHNFLGYINDEEIIASMIAKDHIKQEPNYYSKLITAGLVDEKEAIDLYKSYLK